MPALDLLALSYAHTSCICQAARLLLGRSLSAAVSVEEALIRFPHGYVST